ncbi:putative FAD-linked oxidoreductase YgaK [Actinoplanes sp. NBRC 14428]|uniref:FAD/FMN-containing dehydrogenase n=1 Tax=Pseudosporangium ferrugineum TaxID=439699 RepID=A0A2T0RRU1_9ACTN|nr:FAD-binding protein [Pseudosporangium ferrugineum]PRY23888.1 FAD/FMN-containing dehydrogenase [Pseudosporangium ferrugineum]BCJ51450.1 putative FAD-linked oxidoreductase YgaK [Actinoplanes sp. NBRC 14428]
MRWASLAAVAGGRLRLAGDPGAAEAGSALNQRYATTRPAAVLSVTHAGDVAGAVRWARERSVPLTVRGGGHSYAGYSASAGLVLDLRELRGVRFDEGTGHVTVGGGASMNTLYAALRPYGVTFPLGNSGTVGIGGLTLGGGVTTISRAHGLTCDALVSTDVVLADGSTVTASAREHPDLFWACRGGGGGNFGVNTAFTFATRPAPAGSTCLVLWSWPYAIEVLAVLQEIMRDAPDRFSARIGIARSSGDDGVVSVVGHHLGPAEELRELLAPAFAAARPERADIADRDFWEAARYLHHSSVGGAFAVRTRCTPEAVGHDGLATLVRAVEKWPGSGNPDGAGAALFAWGGAINRVPVDGTAFPHRNARFLLSLDTSWARTDPAEVVRANLDWLHALYADTGEFAPDAAYVNFTDPDLEGWRRSYYGPNAERLAEVKRRYDPGRFFAFPQAV